MVSRYCGECGKPLTGAVRRLLRDPEEAVLGGVCGAIARLVQLDVTLVRVATVLLTFLFPMTLLLYALFWALIPRKEAGE